ncbi:MAG: hypothetical protein IID08_04185 [Candidatus Hydrogenedentes bacterium]|nr:hypothetical protein [Candidatus Hydrogenedentota bacterium]
MNDLSCVRKKLWDINLKLSKRLWELPCVEDVPRPHASRLLIPQYRKKKSTERKLRLSEQEARFTCCALLEHSKIFHYSVETPTEERYSFTEGGRPMSAQTDLSLYIVDSGAYQKVVNIEFKAHQPPQKNIGKDIEKLVRENCSCRIVGNFYHLLEACNSGTLAKLGEKFRESFLDPLMEPEKFEAIWEEVVILFSICVRADTPEQSFALQSWFEPKGHNRHSYVSDFFDFTKFDMKSNEPAYCGWTVTRNRKEGPWIAPASSD